MQELFYFPEFFRPLVNFNYNHSGENIVRSGVSGGLSRSQLRYCQQSVIFSVTFIAKSRIEMQVFNDFYFNISEQGTRKFIMKLRPVAELEEHVCTIVPGSVNVTGGANNAPYNISMSIEAEKINAPFDGELYLLYAAGYSDVNMMFKRIETFANSDLL